MNVHGAALDQQAVDGRVKPAVVNNIVDMAIHVVVRPPSTNAAKRFVGGSEFRLGRLKLTYDGLEARDRRVFDWARQCRIPLAFCMAGGYGVNIDETVQVQVNTFRVALEYWHQWRR